VPKAVGDKSWQQTIHRPGQRFLSGGAELHAGHEDDVWRVRQCFELREIEHVATDRLDAMLPKAVFQLSRGEARHTDDAPLDACYAGGPVGHAGHRRSHLAAYAEKENVAVEPGQRFDYARRRLTEELVEMFHVAKAIGQLSHLHFGHLKNILVGGK